MLSQAKIELFISKQQADPDLQSCNVAPFQYPNMDKPLEHTHGLCFYTWQSEFRRITKTKKIRKLLVLVNNFEILNLEKWKLVLISIIDLYTLYKVYIVYIIYTYDICGVGNKLIAANKEDQ